MTEDGLSFVARLPSPFSVVPKGRRVKVYGGQALAKMEGQKFIHLWRNIK